MTELELEIKSLADAYYNGEQKVEDSVYDALIDRLKKEQPDSELLGKPIGSDLKGINKKYKLEATMGTLDKCNTDEQMIEWWNKHPHNDLVAELKIDGNGQLLTYKNGNLQYSRSRGDGEYGEDTTANVKKVAGVPEYLPISFDGQIRGEVVMLRSVFEEHFPEGKNPRNMAAGIIKRLDGSDCDKLQFIAYDLFDEHTTLDQTEELKLSTLKMFGFTIPGVKTDVTLESLKQWKNSLDPNGEIPCDGIVIKQNKVDRDDLQRHTPLNNVAYKPNCQSATTKIKDIVWQLQGRYFAPVAIVEPVELEGTIVERASISNIEIMNSLGVYIGADVIVSKHGLIIPNIDLVLEPKKDAFDIPTVCPICGGKVIVNSSGIPECVNEACPRKTGHRYKRMFKVLGVKCAGDSFVKNLEDAGIPVDDFLEMCSNNDENIFNKYAGGINGKKIYSQMKNAIRESITPAKFLALFDVPLFDEKKLKLLGNRTLEEIQSLSFSDIISINGFAEITANALLSFLNNYKSEINNLKKYFTFSSENVIIKETKGNICFTGTCETMKRSELTKKAQEAGWTVVDNVTKTTNILVCADPNSGSNKIKSALKNGTKVISYSDFIKEI